MAEPITKGQRVFTCGHSFHVWVPGIVADLAQKADITDHKQVGLSSIGGSRVIQHWDIADEKNKAKEALKTGKVDVLTLSPIFLARSRHRKLHQAGAGAQQGHPHSGSAHLAALGHLRADDQAAREGGSQCDHRRGTAKAARSLFQEPWTITSAS